MRRKRRPDGAKQEKPDKPKRWVQPKAKKKRNVPSQPWQPATVGGRAHRAIRPGKATRQPPPATPDVLQGVIGDRRPTPRKPGTGTGTGTEETAEERQARLRRLAAAEAYEPVPPDAALRQPPRTRSAGSPGLGKR